MKNVGRIIIISIILIIAAGWIGTVFQHDRHVYANDVAQVVTQRLSDRSVDRLLHTGLEIGIGSLIVVTFMVCVYLFQNIGGGALRVVFFGFTVGITLIGLSRVFLFASDLGVYHLEAATIHIWWHMLFVLGILAFIWGAWRLRQNMSLSSDKWQKSRDVYILTALLISGCAIFVVAPIAEGRLAVLLIGSSIDRLGLHHVLALIVSLAAGLLIHRIKKDWGTLLSVSVTPLLVFLLLMGVQHLWELLTESWKVVSLEESFIEGVEQLIVLPAFISLVIGFFRIIGVLVRQKAPSGTVAQVVAIDQTPDEEVKKAP